MRRSPRQAARDEDGQVIVLVAIMFLALVFAVALVVNTGLLFVERRAAQEAADAAALAGALELVATGDTGLATSAANDAARLNGYTAGVTVNIPPLSGPNTGKTNFVEVLIVTSKSTFLTPEWGSTSVGARAVAGGGGPPAQAIYSLGGSGTGLSISNNGVLALYNNTAPAGCSYEPLSVTTGTPWVSPQGDDCSHLGGNAQVDSSSVNSAAVSNGSPGGLIGPPFNVSESVVGCTSPPPSTPKFPNALCAQPSLSDPFFPFPKPVPGTVPSPPSSPNWCHEDTSNLTSASALCATHSGNITNCASSLVLQPGVYTGTISGSCDFIFKPGIYVFADSQNGGIGNLGQGLRVLGNTSGDTFECENVALCGTAAGQIGTPGTRPYHRDATYGNATFPSCGQDATPVNTPRCGVLLFFTYAGYPGTPTSGSCAQLGIAGGSTADLAPEPTGTWRGMLVYYDTNALCVGATINVKGQGVLDNNLFRGLIYAPKATLDMSGNGTVAKLSQLVVDKIIVGNGTVVVNVGSAQTPTVGGLRLTE